MVPEVYHFQTSLQSASIKLFKLPFKYFYNYRSSSFLFKEADLDCFSVFTFLSRFQGGGLLYDVSSLVDLRKKSMIFSLLSISLSNMLLLLYGWELDLPRFYTSEVNTQV